ncbi:DoxX family membrane protein [Cellulomonas fimi]|uniref:DoxX family membrane protein n=1 Tax=Cellulomonas fimi TaxID=1708 RepID=A0A7Y0LZV4_CELFI|nr:DoxX family membrane protein [Cellulomonas fimi]NMR21281.1 DoxX family membrane protein [Cellulomonas fimi]
MLDLTRAPAAARRSRASVDKRHKNHASAQAGQVTGVANPLRTQQPTAPVTSPGRLRTATQLVDLATARLRAVLTRAALPALRISLGLVFLGFGVLKFFPGLSPAEAIVQRTLDTLSFGLVGPSAALLLTAVMETFIGLTLLTGRLLRVGLLVLAGAFVGIMSPLVLFFGDLFPAGGPTLLAQYVLKDVVLVAAAIAVAAAALGARLADSSR